MDWKGIYDSAWHNPIFFWVVAACMFVVIARRQNWLAGFFVLFTFSIFADALASGAFSPTTATAIATPVGIAFVILGDLRYFLLVERYAARRHSAWFGVALAFSFICPVLSAIETRVLPEMFANSRVIFLVYELTFLAIALGFLLFYVPRRYAGAPAAVARWVRRLTLFEVVQYAAWATADIVILNSDHPDQSIGFAIRLVPNALYYAFFLPFAWVTAPREAFQEGGTLPSAEK